MKLDTIIAERLSQLKLFAHENIPIADCLEEFEQAWREMGRTIVQTQLQMKIEQIESHYSGARQKRQRQYQTSLGAIALTRRVYGSKGGVCRVDEVLGLPSDGWMPNVKELATALSVSSEFANANRILQRWSGVKVSERTLANHVESYGEQLAATLETEVPAVCPIVSSVSASACPAAERPVFYIGADGIHVPMQEGGTSEAKVGVMFWQDQHWQVCDSRAVVRQRHYVATLETAEGFRAELNHHYAQIVQQRPHQVVVLGDGAAWIWLMANLLFPDAIQILDFFHLSEYVWEVARAAFPDQADVQQQWVEAQQHALKQSQSAEVVAAVQRLPPSSPGLKQAIDRLLSYLHHNQNRIDYQRYLQLGLMIGSGVVESTNRRIVTQRLKQSGMFWSKRGAQAVMSLRACYLSASNRWHDFWYKSPTAA